MTAVWYEVQFCQTRCKLAMPKPSVWLRAYYHIHSQQPAIIHQRARNISVRRSKSHKSACKVIAQVQQSCGQLHYNRFRYGVLYTTSSISNRLDYCLWNTYASAAGQIACQHSATCIGFLGQSSQHKPTYATAMPTTDGRYA